MPASPAPDGPDCDTPPSKTDGLRPRNATSEIPLLPAAPRAAGIRAASRRVP